MSLELSIDKVKMSIFVVLLVLKRLIRVPLMYMLNVHLVYWHPYFFTFKCRPKLPCPKILGQI